MTTLNFVCRRFVMMLGILLGCTTVLPPNAWAASKPVEKMHLYVVHGTGSGLYTAGQIVPITAHAAKSGTIFSRWSASGVKVADPSKASTQVTIPSSKHVLVVYAQYKPTKVPAGTVPMTVVFGEGSGDYKPGSAVTITAMNPPHGQVFKAWAAPAGLIEPPTKAHTSFVMPSTATRVTALFEAAPQAQSVVTVTGGTGSGKYPVGASVTIEAAAAPAGKVFDHWTGDIAQLASATQPKTLLHVPVAAVSVAAAYKAAPVVNVAVTVTNGVGSGTYTVGQKITIMSNTPPAGQTFAKWTGATSMLADPLAPITVLTVQAPPAGGSSLAVVATFQSGVSPSGGVALSSHKDGDAVSTLGETVFGNVLDAAHAMTLSATIAASARTVPLDFDAASGRFALRLFEGDAPTGAAVALTFTRTALDGTLKVDTFTLTGAAKSAGPQQVLGRLTFGATPALLNDIKTMGYRAWLDGQLNPSSIPDTGLEQMKPQALLRTSLDPWLLRDDIVAWRLAYAAYSQRQLREVMTTFWKNHFWSAEKDDNSDMSNIDEINGFRANAFGNFRDLLRISSHSPMMMYFLDNDRSVAGNINENYARELMELHTVGVNGGYGNDDVIAVARILTGWGAHETSALGALPHIHAFEFRSADHDKADKVVPFLKTTIKYQAGAAGLNEGEQLMDILAMHPSTQKFVCGKLVEAFVSDSKPQAFIDECVAAWAKSNGNMGVILQTLLTDPTYLTTVDFQRSKVKTPYETAASFIRNFGIYPVAGKENDFYDALRWGVEAGGMDMENFAVPTGFREDHNGWANTASFVGKFTNLTTQITWWTNGTYTSDHRGVANYTQLLMAADMKTEQAAAAYLLALGTSDRYRKDEYDMVVDALRSTDGFDLARTNAEARLRKAVGLIVTLPSYQLQ